MSSGPSGPCSPRKVGGTIISTATVSSPSPLSSSTRRSDGGSPRRSQALATSFTALPLENDCTTAPLPSSAWGQEARLCVHADSSHVTTLYPNYLFDPDGDLAPVNKPNTVDMVAFVNQQADGINFAGHATGIIVAYTRTPGPDSTGVVFGSFVQVSPTRAVAAWHTVNHGEVSRDVWVSKSCSITDWEQVFRVPKIRAKYFRQATIVAGFQDDREDAVRRLAGFDTITGPDGLPLSPPTPVDLVVLELPAEFHRDPFLKPLPKNVTQTKIKKIGVVAYNHREPRREEDRLSIYHTTTGIPPYEHEERFLHYGAKSLATGMFVGTDGNYILYEASLSEGSAGGPVVSLARPCYVWGIHTAAFSDSVPPRQSRNFNVAISFYHPAVRALYDKHVLPTLNESDRVEVLAGY